MDIESTSEIIVDLDFSKRLESTEGIANARFVEGRRRMNPDSKAEWIEVAGARAMYDGADSPCTQTFGLGVLGEPSEFDLSHIEDFFRTRGAAVHHEIAPLAPMQLIELLNQRGYSPIEFTNVLYRAIGPHIPLPKVVSDVMDVRIAEPHEMDLWARTSAEGWSEDPSFADMIFALASCYAATEGATCMMASLDGAPVATGVVAIVNGVALLAGASTIARARNRGAQSALLSHRLRFAQEQKCDIAMMCALPGSRSQRNAQRNGFQVAYTRIKWKLSQ